MTKRKIAWIAPPLMKGSGGHRTIFQNLTYIAKFGYESDIYFEVSESITSEKAKQQITDYYGKVSFKNIYIGTKLQERYDLVIATGWHTAEAIKVADCPHKAYFIQDYEPWFYPVGTDHIATQQTYQFGFDSITIGRWLAQKIQNESHQSVAYFDFCADLNIYHHDQSAKENAICCVYQPEKDRRCSDLLLMALHMVKAQRPDLTIYLYGSTTKANVNFEVTELGIISPEKCNDIYNKCCLGVSMGATNPSRIPFEMMAAGLPVVDLYRENNLYDLPNQATTLARPNPHALATTILELLANPACRNQMSQSGVDFMHERPLEKGYQQFLSALNDIFAKRKFKQVKLKPIYREPTIHNSRFLHLNNVKYQQLFSATKHKVEFITQAAHPRNIKKAYQIIQKGGVEEFTRRLKARLNYQYADQRYQYQDYLRIVRPSEEGLERQRKTRFSYKPYFGVVIPLYKTKQEYLDDLLSSFKEQTYANFKLFMIDASPIKEGKTELTSRMLLESEKDPRIIYKILDKNEGIAGNTNHGIKLAMADSEVTHIALCDHDDFIEPDTLYHYAKVLNDNKNAKIIYSDEDVVKMKDDPNAYYVMKPDFNPYLMESCNYINHFFVCEKKLLEKIKTKDGLYEQPKYDGAQDYDLYLRLIEEALRLDQEMKRQEKEKIKSATYTSSTIYHIPRVLYHWRAADNSTAQDPHNKLYAFDAGKRALEAYFKRRQIDINSVEHTDVWGTYRIKYKLKQEPLVSIIIPNKDHMVDLQKAIDSIKRGTYKNLEFVIVENNSTEPETFAYYDKLKQDKNIKITYYEGEYNYSAINNFGVKSASGDILLLLNNDVEMIAPASIAEMVAILQREQVGVVGAQLLFPDSKLQHAGVIIGFGGSAGHIFYRDRPEFSYGNRANCIINYSAVTAACLMVKKSTYDKVGGFDENFTVTFNDVDFCLKIRALGDLIVYTPYAKFYHYESKSRGTDTVGEKRLRMEQEAKRLRDKWPIIFEDGDPYYNQNFSLKRYDCSLREVPNSKLPK